jgi:hypothetical protein
VHRASNLEDVFIKLTGTGIARLISKNSNHKTDVMTQSNQDNPIDLLAIREIFNRQNIMLCFNGPVTAPLIEEIGTALRKHMEGLQVSPSAVSDVFSVYIEMAQNIRRYAQAQCLRK